MVVGNVTPTEMPTEPTPQRRNVDDNEHLRKGEHYAVHLGDGHGGERLLDDGASCR
jgi:hypothetical protein